MKLAAILFGALLWLLLFWAVHQAAADGSEQRTITVLSGWTAHYTVVRHPAGLVWT